MKEIALKIRQDFDNCKPWETARMEILIQIAINYGLDELAVEMSNDLRLEQLAIEI